MKRRSPQRLKKLAYVRLSVEEKRALERYAANRGLSESQVVRALLAPHWGTIFAGAAHGPHDEEAA